MTTRELLVAIRTMLSRDQKRRYIKYQIFFLVAGAMQLVGAGSVAPFVGVLSRPELLKSNQFALSASRILGLENDLQLIVAFAVLMIFLLVTSNLLAAAAVWLTYRFALDVGAEIKDDLLRCYLQRDYVLVAGTNSSDLINKISIGAPRFAFNVLLPLMNIASQGALLLVVLFALAWYQPSVLLVFGMLIGGGYVILFVVVRRKLLSLGEYTWAAAERTHRLLVESLGGFKEIRLSGTELRYRNEHLETTRRIYRAEAAIGVLGDVPRFLLETLAFSALLVLAIIMLVSGSAATNVVTALTLYAMAGYRMLPAGQAIFKAVSQIRTNMPVVSELLQDVVEGRGRKLATFQQHSEREVPEYPAALVLEDVWFRYPSSDGYVLQGVNATIPPKSLTVLVGHSGSGKSTLSDLILGLLDPTKGSVKVGDASVRELGAKWFEALGYVPQSIFLLDDTVAANVAFGSPLGMVSDRLHSALVRARLDELVLSLPEGINYRVGERGARLSGGQRQRLGIARALYHDARYLILDEATSALDGKTEAEVLDALLALRKDRTVVMIAHRLTTIQAADHVIMLHDGRVAAEGAYADLLKTNPQFRSLVQHGEEPA